MHPDQRPPLPGIETILATIPRSVGHLEIRHKETGARFHALAVVSVRPARPPFYICIPHTEIGALKAAIAEYERRAAEKERLVDDQRNASRRAAEDAPRAPGRPRGRVAP